MGMCDADGFTMTVGNLYQPVYLFSDKIWFLDMIENREFGSDNISDFSYFLIRSRSATGEKFLKEFSAAGRCGPPPLKPPMTPP